MKPSEKAWKKMTTGEGTLEITSNYVDLPTVIEILDEQQEKILALEKRVEKLEKPKEPRNYDVPSL